MWTQCLKITKIVAFFKNSPKLTIFGIFNELLSTQNVNVARFARNIECDFFGDFQTLWRRETLVPQQFSFRANIVKIDLNYFDLLKTYNFVIELLLWDWLEFQDFRALKKSKMDFPIFCCIYSSIALFNFQKTELSKKPTKIFENSKNIFYIFFNFENLKFSVFKNF